MRSAVWRVEKEYTSSFTIMREERRAVRGGWMRECGVGVTRGRGGRISCKFIKDG